MIRSRILLILLINGLGILLFLSWHFPENHGIWAPIDIGIFRFFNELLVQHPAFLWFVAITNQRAFDLCSLLCMGLLMLWFWWHATLQDRRYIVIMGIVMLLAGVVLNQAGQLLPVVRPSPTLTLPNVHRASDLVPISTKDASRDSYPGDHGMMLLIFSGFMLRYFGKTAFVIALGIVIIFSMPRIMIGAHWFSDVFNGSLCIVLVGLPWILMTPLSDRLLSWFYLRLPGKHKQLPHR